MTQAVQSELIPRLAGVTRRCSSTGSLGHWEPPRAQSWYLHNKQTQESSHSPRMTLEVLGPALNVIRTVSLCLTAPLSSPRPRAQVSSSQEPTKAVRAPGLGPFSEPRERGLTIQGSPESPGLEPQLPLIAGSCTHPGSSWGCWAHTEPLGEINPKGKPRKLCWKQEE